MGKISNANVREGFKEENALMRMIHFLHHNIVRYKKRYYAIPYEAGPLDIAKVDEETLSGLCFGKDLNFVRQLILLDG
jgi:hypothetical protein